MANPMPANAHIEVKADSIREGKFRKEFDQAIQSAFAELMAREDLTGDRTGQAVITAKVVIQRGKDMDTMFKITDSVRKSVPEVARSTLVKGAGGRLLCQLHGSSDDDPDQMRLFDPDGNAVGILNPDTGEIEDINAVAGKINGDGA